MCLSFVQISGIMLLIHFRILSNLKVIAISSSFERASLRFTDVCIFVTCILRNFNSLLTCSVEDASIKNVHY